MIQAVIKLLLVDTRHQIVTIGSQADLDTEDVIMVEVNEPDSNEKKIDGRAEDPTEVGDEGDDDIEVIKTEIYSYKGEKTETQELEEDIFKYQYFDDFEDDVIILDDDEDQDENGEILEVETEEVKNLSDECKDLLEETEGQRVINHPIIQRKEIKHFGGGHFFMLEA